MPHLHPSVTNVSKIERRQQWRDRRVVEDRRNVVRLQHTEFDCRRETPRRRSDISGELYGGDVWWNDYE